MGSNVSCYGGSTMVAVRQMSCFVLEHCAIRQHKSQRNVKSFALGQRETFSFALEKGLITQANAKSFTPRWKKGP